MLRCPGATVAFDAHLTVIDETTLAVAEIPREGDCELCGQPLADHQAFTSHLSTEKAA